MRVGPGFKSETKRSTDFYPEWTVKLWGGLLAVNANHKRSIF
jgi:hypothetical protein